MFWANKSTSLLCGLGSLAGTGIYGVNENKYYAAHLFDFIEKELGIPQNK